MPVAETANVEAESPSTSEVTADPISDFDTFLEQSRQAVIAEGDQSGQMQDNETRGTETDSTSTTERNPQETEQDSSETDADLDRPTTRREAFKLAEERQKALAEANAENQRLLDQAEARRQADEALNVDVQKALGSDNEYAALTRRARAGDRQAGQMLDQIDANRGFFGKLVQKAQRDVTSFFTGQLTDQAKAVGLDEKTVWEGTPAQIVKAAYEQGRKAAEEELRPQIDGAQARARGASASRVGSRGAPLSGGKPAALDAFDSFFGEDGLPTKEALEKAKRGELAI